MRCSFVECNKIMNQQNLNEIEIVIQTIIIFQAFLKSLKNESNKAKPFVKILFHPITKIVIISYSLHHCIIILESIGSILYFYARMRFTFCPCKRKCWNFLLGHMNLCGLLFFPKEKCKNENVLWINRVWHLTQIKVQSQYSKITAAFMPKLKLVYIPV